MSINTATYYFVSDGKLLSIVTPLVTIIGMVVIMVYATKVGRMGKIGRVDTVCFILAIVVGIFWQISKDSLISNLMMQVVFMISYIPTIVGLARGRLKEKALAWNMAVASYFFLILSILSGERWTMAELIYPTINGLIGNGSIPLILWWKKMKGGKNAKH
ncbi:MAG TPA: hypothetical protein P5276_00970 [Candidatus Paceibacterota bacterium]|nr:hypothetical protein [Candidatus Paceibacterota bacterium]